MRVQDATDAVYLGLRSLDARRYLCAMWIVSGALRSVYEDRLSADESALMASTRSIVRDVVISGQAKAGAVTDAARLSGQWDQMMEERGAEVMPGQLNTWMVFGDLAREITGAVPRYDSADRVDLAATDRWREHLPGPLLEDPGEEVDDSSPMALTLTFLELTVSGVAGLPEERLQELDWDPSLVQAEISGAAP